MSARNRRLRSVIGAVSALFGLVVAGLFADWTISNLKPATIRDLGSHYGAAVFGAIAVLAIIYAFGEAAMRLYDAIGTYRDRRQRR